MSFSKLISALFIALLISASATMVILSKGVINTQLINDFDAWFCQQNLAKDLAQCIHRIEEAPLAVDDLNIDTVSQVLGNWGMSDSAEDQARAIREIMAASLLVSDADLSRERERAILVSVYSKYWGMYPEFVVSSRCIACGVQRSVLKTLANSIDTKDGFREDFALASAEMLPLISRGRRVPPSYHDQVSLMAELLSNGGSHSMISPTMIDAQRWEMVRANFNNGGAYGAFSGQNLETMPYELVTEAWEKALSRGDFEPGLTRFLLARGHRPALRLVIWIQAGLYDYLRYSQAKRIKPLLSEFSDFGDLQGRDLAEYYSSNWRDIQWDKTSQKWTKTMRAGE